MNARRPHIGLALTLVLFIAVTACSPGRSIHRGNWPDGRLRVQPAPAPMAVAPATAEAVLEPVEAWPADSGMSAVDPGMSAADLNRMGVLAPVFFDYDSSRLGPDQMATLEQNIAWLSDYADASIIVEGHCDERGSQRYNLDLGQRRAEAARDFLVSRGIDPRRIELVSYGEELPAEHGHHERAWASNRRAEFVIVATGR